MDALHLKSNAVVTKAAHSCCSRARAISFCPLRLEKLKIWTRFSFNRRSSLSVFKDKAGADESGHLAAHYVKEHLSKFITQKPEIIEGPIKAHD
jgi:hypothetical protein